MLNSQKFKTAEERAEAFEKFCYGKNCDDCILRLSHCKYSIDTCVAFWLDLEAEEEKPLPCPFCGGETEMVGDGTYQVVCMKCMYASAMSTDRDRCVSDHNRVARAVIEAGKKEEK